MFASNEGSGETAEAHLSLRCCTMQQVLKICADSLFFSFFQKLKLNDFVSPSQLPDLRKTIHYGKKSIAIRKTLPGTYHRVSSQCLPVSYLILERQFTMVKNLLLSGRRYRVHIIG